jgi:hypothetical protein
MASPFENSGLHCSSFTAREENCHHGSDEQVFGSQ